MKVFLKKLFWVDAPAQGAFLAWTLVVFGSWWCLLSWTFSDAWYQSWAALWTPGIIRCIQAMPWRTVFWFVIWLLLVVYAVAVMIVWRVAGGARDAFRHPALPGGVAVSAVGLLLMAGVVLVALSRDEPGLSPWIGRLLCRSWMFYLGTVLVLGGYGLIGRGLAQINHISRRQMFHPATRVVIVICLLTYFVSLWERLDAERQVGKAVAELEAHFRHPLSAAALEQLYRAWGEPDGGFWEQVRILSDALPWTGASGPDIFTVPDADLSPEVGKKWRSELEAAVALRQLETLFDQPPPLYPRNYRQYLIVATALPELRLLRDFARSQCWRVRFAAVDGDAAAVLDGLRRLEYVRRYLGADHLLISHLVMISVENGYLDVLERVLPLLPESELKKTRQSLRDRDREMAEMQLRAVYGEAVLAKDFCDGFAAGRRTSLMMVTEGDADGERLSLFRLCGGMLPGVYGHFFRNEAEMLRRFRVSGFSEMRSVKPGARNMLSAMMLPGLAQVAARERALSARYRAMTVLIDAELSKRSTGFYPENMSDLPVDPFSGQPMRYCNARIPVIRRVFREDLRSWENRLVAVDAVMVWSIGPDGRDDRGLCGRLTEADRAYDDPRALLLKDGKTSFPVDGEERAPRSQTE